MVETDTALDGIRAFLPCATPQAWIEAALSNPEELLIDHAHCEKKAASTALALLYRYPGHGELLQRMSRLAREELRHFEQVVALMVARGVAYRHLPAGRYAGALHELVRSAEPGRLVDTLVVGALIEARSCERFAALAPCLDDELARFYRSLLRSEARHFQDYLALAGTVGGAGEVEARVAVFAARERELIQAPDTQFRFHSGPPLNAAIQ